MNWALVICDILVWIGRLVGFLVVVSLSTIIVVLTLKACNVL